MLIGNAEVLWLHEGMVERSLVLLIDLHLLGAALVWLLNRRSLGGHDSVLEIDLGHALHNTFSLGLFTEVLKIVEVLLVQVFLGTFDKGVVHQVLIAF